MTNSKKGFIKLTLGLIGLAVVLSLAGVRLSVVQTITLEIWREIILPIIVKLHSFL